MSGALSVEASFECLYRMYAPVVAGWLAIRVDATAVEDWSQDVWTVFYQRWRMWRQKPALDAPTLAISEPAVDHRYRNVLARLQEQLPLRAGGIERPIGIATADAPGEPWIRSIAGISRARDSPDPRATRPPPSRSR